MNFKERKEDKKNRENEEKLIETFNIFDQYIIFKICVYENGKKVKHDTRIIAEIGIEILKFINIQKQPDILLISKSFYFIGLYSFRSLRVNSKYFEKIQLPILENIKKLEIYGKNHIRRDYVFSKCTNLIHLSLACPEFRGRRFFNDLTTIVSSLRSIELETPSIISNEVFEKSFPNVDMLIIRRRLGWVELEWLLKIKKLIIKVDKIQKENPLNYIRDPQFKKNLENLEYFEFTTKNFRILRYSFVILQIKKLETIKINLIIEKKTYWCLSEERHIIKKCFNGFRTVIVETKKSNFKKDKEILEDIEGFEAQNIILIVNYKRLNSLPLIRMRFCNDKNADKNVLEYKNYETLRKKYPSKTLNSKNMKVKLFIKKKFLFF